MTDRRIRIRPKSGARNLYYGSGSASGSAARDPLSKLSNKVDWSPTKALPWLSPNAPNVLGNGVVEGLANAAGNAAQGNPVGDLVSRFVSSSGADLFGMSSSSGSSSVGSANILQPLAATDGMVFPYTPTVSMSQSIDYSSYDPVHSNQEFLAYTRTRAATINLSGQFTSQNDMEASYSLAAIHFLRTVSKMAFGESRNPGTPPPVLLLSGYGEYMFNDLPVILQSFAVDFDPNVDTMRVPNTNTYVPTLFNISCQFIIQNTPAKIRQFNLEDFRSGKLVKKGGWF